MAGPSNDDLSFHQRQPHSSLFTIKEVNLNIIIAIFKSISMVTLIFKSNARVSSNSTLSYDC